MNGQTLIREVRNLNKEVAFIVLTGHGDLNTAYELLEQYRISDFLTKPLHNPSQLLFSVQNALEKQRLQKQIFLSNKKLKEANKEIKNFANIVSHDLRAPLVNLKGFSQELRTACGDIEDILKEVSASLTDKQRKRIDELLQKDVLEAVNFINSSTSTMDRLVSNILILSRAGRRELNFEKIKIEKFVKEKLKTLNHQIETRGIKIKLNELPNVKADKSALDQIFGNILSNAIKYLEPDRPGVIEIMGERRKEQTLFIVRDNGRGIAEEDFHKVFEIFRRAGKPCVQGEGMGLPYAKVLVERHDGEICFESKEGVGTTFYFTISDKLV